MMSVRKYVSDQSMFTNRRIWCALPCAGWGKEVFPRTESTCWVNSYNILKSKEPQVRRQHRHRVKLLYLAIYLRIGIRQTRYAFL